MRPGNLSPAMGTGRGNDPLFVALTIRRPMDPSGNHAAPIFLWRTQRVRRSPFAANSPASLRESTLGLTRSIWNAWPRSAITIGAGSHAHLALSFGGASDNGRLCYGDGAVRGAPAARGAFMLVTPRS